MAEGGISLQSRPAMCPPEGAGALEFETPVCCSAYMVETPPWSALVWETSGDRDLKYKQQLGLPENLRVTATVNLQTTHYTTTVLAGVQGGIIPATRRPLGQLYSPFGAPSTQH